MKEMNLNTISIMTSKTVGKYIEVRKLLQNLVLQIEYRSIGSLNVKFN